MAEKQIKIITMLVLTCIVKMIIQNNGMKRPTKIADLPILGLIMVNAGLVYDVIFAGIQYQD